MEYTRLQTEFGVVSGRDAILLERTKLRGRKLILRGTVAKNALSRPPEVDGYDLPLRIAFEELIGLRIEELDVVETERFSEGVFLEVRGSSWLADMKRWDAGGKARPEHRHYVLQTYDDVFEVVATGYTLQIGDAS